MTGGLGHGTVGNVAVWKIVLAVLLAVGSAIAAGLTLGILTLDLLQLRILISCGEAPGANAKAKRSAKQARRILKVRRRGNFLLITLLIVNVATNAAFSILMGDTTSGLAGFFISTAVITLFGEILPQSVCARYGLPICSHFVPVIILAEIILSPIAFPLAWTLDKMLGEDLGITYTREQLGLLLEHHQKEAKILHPDEVQILGGGLMIHKKKAKDAMTPMNDVLGLQADEYLSVTSLTTLFSSGFSRIPVFNSGAQNAPPINDDPRKSLILAAAEDKLPTSLSVPSASASRRQEGAQQTTAAQTAVQQTTKAELTTPTQSAPVQSGQSAAPRVVGFIFIKDLLLLKGVERISCRDLLLLFHNKTIVVDENTPLLTLLNFFKAGQSHIAVVAANDSDRSHVGIITLEDILEEILQDEIKDEFDYDENPEPSAHVFNCKDLLDSQTKSKHVVPLGSKDAVNTIQEKKRPCIELERRSAIMRLFHERSGKRKLDHAEARVLLKFLKGAYASIFGRGQINSPNALQFLCNCPVLEFDDDEEIPFDPFKAHLVLQGSMKEIRKSGSSFVHGALQIVNVAAFELQSGSNRKNELQVTQPKKFESGARGNETKFNPVNTLVSGGHGCYALELSPQGYLAVKNEIISDPSFITATGETPSVAISDASHIIEFTFQPGSQGSSREQMLDL